ncbi:ABC transporter substrate-binding protein [Paenibacillus sp. NPDC058174]|uniref:ABC transporter substrate-binding protein n=1 Tax=Paenibacillus sp. NPDC058174 TaxID=3346366 RepID=UPI0036DA1AB0
MNRKWLSASVWLLCMMLILAACGGKESKGEKPAPEGAAEKMDEITIAFPMISTILNEMPAIEASINEITQAKINTKVHLKAISSGEWRQQINLMFTGSETIDLMFVNGNLYPGMVSKNQLTKLDELLDKYGSGIKEAVGSDYIKVPMIKGATYGVPTIRDLAANYGVIMRKDLVDKYNIDLNAINKLEDLDSVFKKIKEGEGIEPFVSAASGNSFVDAHMTWDSLGDNLGVLPGYDNNLKVVNLYETDEYKNLLNLARGWYTKGYIAKDAATSNATSWDRLKSNTGFAFLAAFKPGIVEQETKAAGIELVGKELTDIIARSGTVSNVMWGIPSISKNAEAAMKFLNLMYTDKDIVNLFDWGIEGKHYVKVEGKEGVIRFPDNVNAKTTTYSMPLGYLFGNQFLSYTMEENDPDIWKKTAEFNQNARHSKAMGFTFDPTPVKTEYAAVSNVVTQYRIALESGTVDPAKVLPDFIAKLKSAGIDKIIAEKQKQLDDWAGSSASK